LVHMPKKCCMIAAICKKVYVASAGVCNWQHLLWVRSEPGTNCRSDNTKQCVTLLGLQVQSVVVKLILSTRMTRSKYQTLGEQSKKLSSFLSGNLQNNFLVLRPQLHRVVVKHMVLNVSKIK
jgi:hypothetical protein